MPEVLADNSCKTVAVTLIGSGSFFCGIDTVNAVSIYLVAVIAPTILLCDRIASETVNESNVEIAYYGMDTALGAFRHRIAVALTVVAILVV